MAIMDADAIQAVLEAGRIGNMPYLKWRELASKPGLDESLPWMGKPLPVWLSELGVEAVRWEQENSNPDARRLWQAFLVVTLPEVAFSPEPSLQLLDDIAVEACGSYLYCLKGRELWMEYLVARPEVRVALEATIRAGKIGDLPFPQWFRYNPASTNISMIAHSLAARGVREVRWEIDEYERKAGVNWQAYLVSLLPRSTSLSPPSLPPYRLVSEIGMTLRREHNCFTRVTDSGVEVWVSYKIGLPLEEPPGELIEEDGISYISFATPKARKQRVRKLRRELWRAARDLVKHYTRG